MRIVLAMEHCVSTDKYKSLDSYVQTSVPEVSDIFHIFLCENGLRILMCSRILRHAWFDSGYTLMLQFTDLPEIHTFST